MRATNYADLYTGETVNSRIYTDPDIFHEEMDRIFKKTWVYVAHESEIENPGDYKTGHLGQLPIIITRGADEQGIQVLINRCMHRGASICQSDCGNANFFRCAYHGWTYKNDGALIGMPFQDGYGPDTPKSDLGLVKAPRVDSYQGFIFASMNEEVKPLKEHLGLTKPYLDMVAASGPQGVEVKAGVQRYKYPYNWKLQFENTLDPYHASITHQSFFDILGKKMGQRINFSKLYEVEIVRDLENGHSIYNMNQDFGIGDLPFIMCIFPNLGLLGSQIRVIQPVSAKETKVSLYPMLLKGASKEVNAARLRKHEIFYGPAGQGTADDLEVAFDRVREGIVDQEQDQWLLIKRGLHREKRGEDGIVYSNPSDELSFRSFYKEWKRLMADGTEASV